jgi:hypothetical protein
MIELKPIIAIIMENNLYDLVRIMFLASLNRFSVNSPYFKSMTIKVGTVIAPRIITDEKYDTIVMG